MHPVLQHCGCVRVANQHLREPTAKCDYWSRNSITLTLTDAVINKNNVHELYFINFNYLWQCIELLRTHRSWAQLTLFVGMENL